MTRSLRDASQLALVYCYHASTQGGYGGDFGPI